MFKTQGEFSNCYYLENTINTSEINTTITEYYTYIY